MKIWKSLILLAVMILPLRSEEWSFDLPPTEYYTQEVHADWRRREGVGLTVQLVGDKGTSPLLVSFYLQTEEGHWLESREDLILDGTVQRFELSMQEDSVDWRMSNGDRVFGKDLLRRVRSWGLRLYSAQPQSGVLRVGRLELREQHVLKAPEYSARELPQPGLVGETVSLMVEPRNGFGDLFDPEQSPTFEVRLADGSRFLPTVWVQEYRRRQIPGLVEAKSIPWRRPVFRALWTPEGEGSATLFLHLPLHLPEGQGDPVNLGTINILAADGDPVPSKPNHPPVNSDFWKEPAADMQLWQMLPGHPGWQAAEIKGLWTPRLDWTSAWGRYDGLGEFMQPRASDFEQWLAQASTSGPLRVVTENVLDNRSTFNWIDHPWNLKNGGRHIEPAFLWSDPEWMDLVIRRAVYLWNRYGAYEQCTGLYIEVTRGSVDHTEWINELTRRLQEELPGVPVYCPGTGLPERTVTSTVTLGSEGWQKPDQLHGADEFMDTQPEGAKILMGASALGFDAAVQMMQHWSDRQVLQLDVEAQFSDGVFPSIQVHVRTDPNRVFASKIVPLHNRELNRVFLDLDDPEAWTCFQNPDQKWTPLERMNVREVILRVYSDKPDPAASFKIQQVVTVTHPLAGMKEQDELKISNLQTPGEKTTTLEKQEWIFDLTRFFHNPYNPQEIAVDLDVLLPNGETVRQPGFFNQQVRRTFEKGVESWELEEAFDWRVRFRPWMDGKHEWKLNVVYTPPGGGEKVKLAEQGAFRSNGRGNARGFVLQSKKDPRYFEFQNGEFFYPLGHTMRNPTDRRPGIYDDDLMNTLDAAEDKGTEIYADWFSRMQENNGNFARVWMSNWWLGLEWNSRHNGYHGRKYFNQLNAARLDRLIALAEQYGMYLNLETTNHGTFSSTTDAEWDENPWSAFSPDEGPIRYASEFVTSEEGKRWHEYKMRYLIARVGHSPSVAFWGVLTETEWSEAYNRSFRNLNPKNRKEFHPNPYRTDEFREPVKQWTNETAAYLKNVNAHPALATTHFSNPNNGLDFWRLPELSVIYNNAYSGFFNKVRPSYPSVNAEDVKHNYPQVDPRRDPFHSGIVREVFGYADFFKEVAREDRIVLIGEWGGRPSNNRDDHLIAEFHSGLWSALVSDLSGVGGFWWFNLVDYHDLFPRYAAASKFMEGEDLRGKNYVQSRWAVSFSEDKPNRDHFRLAIGKATDREAVGYIYSKALSHTNRSVPAESFEDENFPDSGPGWLAVPASLENGQYRVEYWNTFTGEIVENETVLIYSGHREVAIPAHRVDLAVKLKYEKELPPPALMPVQPTPTPAPTPLPPPPPPPPPPPTPTPLPQIMNPVPPPAIS